MIWYFTWFIPVYPIPKYSEFWFVQLWLFHHNEFVYQFGRRLSSVHWWKPRVSCVYTNCKMLWSQGRGNRVCSFRTCGFFEMLWGVFVFRLIVCLVVTPARRLGGINRMSQQVSCKEHKSCAIIESELALLYRSLVFWFHFRRNRLPRAKFRISRNRFWWCQTG